jgi:hypothetical protein
MAAAMIKYRGKQNAVSETVIDIYRSASGNFTGNDMVMF